MPDTPLEHGFGSPYEPLVPRVARVEADMGELRQYTRALLAAVTRIETVLPHLATQAQIGELRGELADKPGKLYLWGVLGVLVATIVASYGAGLTALPLLH